jgi:hypothetical protein
MTGHRPGRITVGVPEAHIVNAAFTHHGPHGRRFHSPQRGAWYAGVELEKFPPIFQVSYLR